MREELLVQMPRANVTIQVVPYHAGGHIGMLGAFVIAEAADMSSVAFLENAADGQTVEDTDRVAQITRHDPGAGL